MCSCAGLRLVVRRYSGCPDGRTDFHSVRERQSLFVGLVRERQSLSVGLVRERQSLSVGLVRERQSLSGTLARYFYEVRTTSISIVCRKQW